MERAVFVFRERDAVVRSESAVDGEEVGFDQGSCGQVFLDECAKKLTDFAFGILLHTLVEAIVSFPVDGDGVVAIKFSPLADETVPQCHRFGVGEHTLYLLCIDGGV